MGYEHDVFVSYAHADNEVPEGSSARYGWVTTLARNLNTGPNVYRKNIFIDHHLKPGDVFSDDLVAKVGRSALLVLLLSQNYIDSEWCGKELDHFIRTHANDPDKPADVFVVELFPYEELTQVPGSIQNIRKRLIHAKFWLQPTDIAAPVLAGYPTPDESGSEGKVHYWRVLNELRGAIDSRLRARRIAPSSAAESAEITASLARAATPALGTVLLADVTDDLEAQRNAVRVALEPEGIAVLPAGDYVGLAPEEFESAIEADLEQSHLFVQLLSLTAGRKGRGFAAPLPQLQFERAVAAKLPIAQWCEQLPAPGQIADEKHARLFETEFVRATNLDAFKSEIIARLHMLKQQREKPATAAPGDAAAGAARKKVIFIDGVASAPALYEKLRAIILGAHCDIRKLPPTAPLGNDGIDVRELLKPCRAGITIYADRTKFLTVYNRLVFFLNQIAEASLPVARWGVYLEQGTVASEFGIESDDVVAVNEQGMADFLGGL
jgi:hypothetical protein